MTDAEIVTLCAMKVMGYRPNGDGWYSPAEDKLVWPYGFDPLKDNSANCAVLDGVVSTHPELHLWFCCDDGWHCTVYGRDGGINVPYVDVSDKDRRRCIVLAALRAKGVEIE